MYFDFLHVVTLLAICALTIKWQCLLICYCLLAMSANWNYALLKPMRPVVHGSAISIKKRIL